MRILPIYPMQTKLQNKPVNFTSETVFQENKIIEKDVLTLYSSKSLLTNPINPKQDILGVRLNRMDEKTINIVSRYGNKTGEIYYNKNGPQPQINLQVGAFQPVIELKDEELGITILLTRGANLIGSNIAINYKNLAKPNVSFGNRLVVTQGYKADKTKEVTDNYFSNKKFLQVEESAYAEKLEQDYTIVGLGGGYGSRLKPISDLYDGHKPSTMFPGAQKSLFEVSVLDTAARAGKIDSVGFIKDNPENLTGTAGPIIKGLKSGLIPSDKPLVLLTGDTFNNIDLAKALYNYEQDKTCGLAMLVTSNNPKDTNLLDKSLVKLDDFELSNKDMNSSFSVIDNFSDKLTADNYQQNVAQFANQNSDKKVFISSNIIVVHPKILQVLKNYANPDGKADFTEFLGLMFNVLNKPNESLTHKYPQGLSAEKLSISDLADYYGRPKPIYNENRETLKVKAGVVNPLGENIFGKDVGTVEDYIETIRAIKNSVDDSNEIKRLNPEFVNAIEQNVDENGVIYMDAQARAKLDKFKLKYGIKNLSGNVIVHAAEEKSQIQDAKNIFELTAAEDKAQDFIKNIVQNPKESKKKIQNMINQYGLNNFLNWYLSSEGYYGAYEKFVQNKFENAKSIEELLQLQPNWAPWKLEEKSWLLDNPQYKSYSKDYKKDIYDRYADKRREVPFQIGDLPQIFQSKYAYESLISKLKTQDIKDQMVYVAGENYSVKRLKGGELNNKFIYLLESQNKKYILKFDRINVEDSENVDYRNLSFFEKKEIRKHKYLSADSIYSNACISKYLELNGCNCVPKLYYYNHTTHSAVYEYIEDPQGDKFQQDLIDEEYTSLAHMNDMCKEINSYGIYMNDTAIKNVLQSKNGENKFIDLGHSNFIDPLKPGVKHYNIEFANTNGPDLRGLYAGLMLSGLN